MDKLKVAANFLKSKFQTDELDAKLTEAVSEENWQASTQLLHEISNASFNIDNQQRIIIFIWEKLRNKSWKKVLKTLHLIDFLIKYGPTSLIDNLKENIYEFRKLDDYTNKGEGLDRGESVRKQAKAVLVLLTDDQLLHDQRAKAKQIKERMSTVIGSGAYFGNFNNESKSSSSDYKGGSAYGNINSQSFKYVPQPNKGTTFGQSVMRQLYQKKKPETFTETQSPQLSSGLNLQHMIEKKIEKKVDSPTKSSFNSLNLKLVKPPEKKPGEKPALVVVKSQTQSKTVQKPFEKEAKKKVDIMDFDFGGATAEPTRPINTLNFLGTQTSQQKNSPNSFNLFQQHSSTPQTSYSPPSQHRAGKGDLMGLDFTNPQPSQAGTTVNQVSHPSYSLTPVSADPQSFNLIGDKNNGTWGFSQSASQVPAQQLKLSLEVKPESTVLKKDEGSLIDFSNFREELGSLQSKGKNESIATNWNW